MEKKKAIIQEYFSPYRLRIWQLIWEHQELGIIIGSLGKKVQREVRWFVKNKFLFKKREKGQTFYKPNLRSKVVKVVIDCIAECEDYEIMRRLKRGKKK